MPARRMRCCFLSGVQDDQPVAVDHLHDARLEGIGKRRKDDGSSGALVASVGLRLAVPPCDLR
jgi:hypothetical protein